MFAEMKQVAQHLPFERREVADGIGPAVFLVLVDRFFQLRAQRLVSLAAIQRAPHQPAQPGPTIPIPRYRFGHFSAASPQS